MPTPRIAVAFSACALMFAAPSISGTGAEPLDFEHEDWELVCDNTRTCRAVGYQNDEVSAPVSVLLTRKAGPGSAIIGRVSLGDDWNESVLDDLPERFRATLSIDGRAHGSIAMRQTETVADLTPAQVAALLKALARDTRIEFNAGKHRWTLSDRGASAVLLKMDEAQGRIGTPGALRRPGKRKESDVLPALPAPIVRAAKPHPPKPADAGFLDRHGDAVRAAIRAEANEDDCMDLFDRDEPQPLEIARLTKTKLLVSTRCWLAAYNAGEGYWIVDDAPPFKAEFVTESANGYENGKLSASHKGRGIGDCWSSEEWTWDGKTFVATGESTTGQCKGFPGGAWTLPTMVTEVIEAR